MDKTFEKITALPAYKKALEILKEEETRCWEETKELVLIPAFARYEEKKADRYQEMLEQEGFATIRDEVNNVYSVIKGTGNGPTVYITAHLDTVFPLDTPLAVEEKEPGKFYCPGISDDTVAVTQVFGIARAIRDAGLKFKGDLIFGANVGEEGLGDLYGMRCFFKDHPSGIDGFITVEGGGEGLCYGGTGSYRYEVTFSGPGGHSNGSFGMPNPIHAMGRAIAKFADIDVPSEPKTTFNVGVVSGGTSVNSIAISCSMLVDMRSNGKTALDELDAKFKAIISEAVEEENQRWIRDRAKYSDRFAFPGMKPLCENAVQLSVEMVGNRPVGEQSEDAPIVELTSACYNYLNLIPRKNPFSSTDANIPISLGVPGVALGAGGKGGGAHSAAEWFNPEGMADGQAKLILLLAAMLGVNGETDPLLPKKE